MAPGRSWRRATTEVLLPPQQRRSLDELAEGLDLSSGDASSKRSAFWTMLVLSAVVATAGVLSDSTATVIGAMIIAPLSTPIMGAALGLARTEPTLTLRSLGTVAAGVLAVVAVGVLGALAVPGVYDLVGNSQVAGRVSPGLLDLAAAVATGFAGAVGLARKDVAAVLPGVAIAISLVPPLAVVGICAGQGRGDLAAGAALLFVSNLLALVLAGTLVFAALDAEQRSRRGHRRAYRAVLTLLVVVGLLLGGNTAGTVALEVWTARARVVAEEWAAPSGRTEVTDVQLVGFDYLLVSVRTADEPPDVGDLVVRLGEDVWMPQVDVVVETTLGRRYEAGRIDTG